MNVRNLILAVMAALVVQFLASLGWAADTYLRPQALNPCTEEPCAEESCMEACNAEPACCAPPCAPTRYFFGEFLYLRPRNDGLEYAVPSNLSLSAPSVQVGRTASLNPQFEPGFRVGGGIEFDSCSTISVAFTHYENSVDDSISTDAPFVLRSMVRNPSVGTAPQWLDASAHQFMKFDLVDLDYRHVFYCNERTDVDYVVGFRYASLRQTFASQFEPIITEDVDANVNFDGGGIRLGLEGQRSAACCNLFVYGKAAASFLGGEFRANYLQTDATSVLPTSQTDWKEARLVSILDCEVGLGWASCNGHVRASAGYMISGWLNVVKTSEFISAVQADQFHGPDKIDGNGLVFDGLVTRLELQW